MALVQTELSSLIDAPVVERVSHAVLEAQPDFGGRRDFHRLLGNDKFLVSGNVSSISNAHPVLGVALQRVAAPQIDASIATMHDTVVVLGAQPEPYVTHMRMSKIRGRGGLRRNEINLILENENFFRVEHDCVKCKEIDSVRTTIRGTEDNARNRLASLLSRVNLRTIQLVMSRYHNQIPVKYSLRQGHYPAGYHLAIAYKSFVIQALCLIGTHLGIRMSHKNLVRSFKVLPNIRKQDDDLDNRMRYFRSWCISIA
ncbi:hypothetical protein H4582DRAFT_2053705 [Lactarius indigo]|nr:hypothetical protein H4582DRAFT_2053705 [Lactarius indigo]